MPAPNDGAPRPVPVTAGGGAAAEEPGLACFVFDAEVLQVIDGILHRHDFFGVFV